MSCISPLGLTACLALLCATPGAVLAKQPTPVIEYGAPPTWERFRDLSEAAIRAILVDPESAKFTWTYGFRQGGFKPFLSAKIYGYTACGTVNSRNRMGGYAGASMFVVVIDHDRVLYSELDKSGVVGYVGDGCIEGVRRGMFPLLTESPPADGASPADAFGFTLTAVPDGAYIATVSVDSGAAKAGLKPGMVISHVNGVALKGMTAQMLEQIVRGTDGPATLTIIGLGTVRIPKIASSASSTGSIAPLPASPVSEE